MEIFLITKANDIYSCFSNCGIHMLADVAGCKEPKKLHKSSIPFSRKNHVEHFSVKYFITEQSNKVMFLFFKTHEFRWTTSLDSFG